ncbi:chlororespiratory reduction protein 7 [Richelia intracellularis]|uniref:chlororespiratory reduction protein 7 n=1 Tax=Richelia intracellularis TaxID=1164990 RepID=UPI0005C5291A|nr:chlororespiratory reduction protein 7 [Richelia intracellularis]
MSNSLSYQQEYFVVLETNQPEQFLTKYELRQKLQTVLEKIPLQDLPVDLQKFDCVLTRSQNLIDTSCELDIGEGEYLQWYAVRLEK